MSTDLTASAATAAAGLPHALPRMLNRIVIDSAVIVVFLLTFPRSPNILMQDDLDFIVELQHMSYVQFMMKTNPAGQFVPIFKALYGAGMLAFHYRTIPLQVGTFIVRMATFGFLIAILRRLRVDSAGGIVVLLAAAVAHVGMIGIFFWPLLGALELALFFFAAAVDLVASFLENGSALRLLLACGCLVASSLCWGAGFAPPFGVAAAFAVANLGALRTSARMRAALLGLTLAAGAGVVVYFVAAEHSATDAALSLAFHHYAVVLRSFFYAGVVNGALSGLFPFALPGVVHVLAFVVLCSLFSLLWIYPTSAATRFAALAALFTQLGIPALIAITRWSAGVAHATSPRYIYANVPLQLFLVALFVGVLSRHVRSAAVRASGTVLAAAFFVCAAVSGAQGRRENIEYESLRGACEAKIVSQPRLDPCLSSVYYRADPNFVRDALLIVQREQSH